LGVAAALAAGVATTSLAQEQVAPAAAAAARSELRWTPHRAALVPPGAASAPAAGQPEAPLGPQPTQPRTADAAAGALPAAASTAVPPAAQQTTRPAQRVAQAPPASVGLPDGVPAVVPPRTTAQRRPAQPRNQRLDDWQSPNRIPGPFRETAGTGGLRLPEIDQVFRAPQGDGGRPLLAAEGTPRGAARGPAVRRPATTDGGLAPRFNPSAGRTASRGDRLAMNNVDALPSVMTRAPQAAAIEGGGGRAPGTIPAPAQPLPAPAASPEPSIVIDTMPQSAREYVGGETIIEGTLPEGYLSQSMPPEMAGGDGGLWMGDYPTQLHVESFYDDPFACEEGDGCLPLIAHDGRICAWLRQFGRPYYGWRWYRDFTASAGVSAFENQADFGLRGNFGFNEYLNWAMPFWNAFGIGWQVGVRGVQSNFSGSSLDDTTYGRLNPQARDQVFLTTGFFTRAFQGRGLQGGAVYDYLSDKYYETVDVAQIRGELSYVWGFHELGFWGAFNALEQTGYASPALPTPGMAGTIDLYTAFYRLHFGDANEARVWGGASGDGQGIIGSSIRAPMSRSWALEGTFTYLMPAKSQVTPISPENSVIHTPQAWNVGVNLVWYPAGRARRSLASPYRPLFDVADNGSMIRGVSALPTP
jgi:hypothetical protein